MAIFIFKLTYILIEAITLSPPNSPARKLKRVGDNSRTFVFVKYCYSLIVQECSITTTRAIYNGFCYPSQAPSAFQAIFPSVTLISESKSPVTAPLYEGYIGPVVNAGSLDLI